MRNSSSMSDSLSVVGGSGGSGVACRGGDGGATAGGEGPSSVASRSLDQSCIVERIDEGSPKVGLPKTRTECSALGRLVRIASVRPVPAEGGNDIRDSDACVVGNLS